MNDAAAHGAGVRSRELYERACRVIPAGVNSPVRAFRAVGGTPLFIARGAGQYLYDVDGRRYLDLVNSWGALILGHAHPGVVAAMEQACRRRHDLRRAVRCRSGTRRAHHRLLSGA